MFKIKTLNNIAGSGLAEFNKQCYLLGNDLDQPDAILVRSFDMHHFAMPPSVQIIGRAGAGTNNIPVAQMTTMGIPVLNTPGANANAVKELVIAGMLLAARNLCEAWQFVQNLNEIDDDALSSTVEQHKKQFSGHELPGKTLGVIGLGHIGVKIANVAIDLGMRVIGFDPAMTVRNAWELSPRVQQAESLAEVISQADYLTLHIPLIDATRGLINANNLRYAKPGLVLLNFARDGIVTNADLLAALASKQVSRYVCDFPAQAFKSHPQVISLPHLGASTAEAEENCARMVALQIQDYLENGNIRNSVNFPEIKLPYSGGNTRLAIININKPNMVAQVSTVLSNANINIVDMLNKSRGNIAYTLVDVNANVDTQLLSQIKTIDGVIRARIVLCKAVKEDCLVI